jgi:hypothetical protein
MNQTYRIALIMTLAAILSACNQTAEPVQPAAPATSEAPASTTPAVAQAAPAPSSVVDSLARNLTVDKVNTIPGVGAVENGALVGSGKPGFLMYGPYVPFAAGSYTVTIKGRIETLPAGTEARFDAVSARGNTGHGKFVRKATGDIGSFDIVVDKPVADLEIRAWVPNGSKVVIESYEVVRKNP